MSTTEIVTRAAVQVVRNFWIVPVIAVVYLRWGASR